VTATSTEPGAAASVAGLSGVSRPVIGFIVYWETWLESTSAA
jgi:hypothetical protein